MSKSTRSSTRESGPAHIIIADDHDLSRAGLRSVFDHARDMRVVGEAANGQAAVELCQQLQPHLAVLDVRMPVLDGLAATKAIKSVAPLTSVLIVSFHADPEYVVKALRSGAAGYLLKDASRAEILDTARQVMRGEALLHGNQAADLLRRAASDEQYTLSQRPPLTRREREVLHLVTEGLTNREIAERLGISPGTVKNHVEHIIAKLNVSDRTQAAVYALRYGLLNT
ncbi:response regulator [Candidatus Viridilinea mediisalina]|uniref:DNA-binding response regulator n=1 Tax=Candidatus Viridilinea mediisalina TaxID=2024553 RepID=A0A2A6RHZ7_9CHLR|nr:response regulator transcription factor [Candidatus Viridilinea mediisalina]PDW02754.1 DNA-binding response regulator [Candidatus Viridilinea mediisalina]